MLRENRYVASHRPYAVDLSSWTRSDRSRQAINAIWFRRKKGDLIATFGELWDYSAANDVQECLRLHDDGRYGGDWIASWDGVHLWSQHTLPKAELDRYAELLDAALVGFVVSKAVPDGFDGWWTFVAGRGGG
jgi:hypothetical protein